MLYRQALDVVRTHGREMLESPASGLTAVAVGRRGGGAIGEASRDDFVVAGYVKEKLLAPQLASRNLQPFSSTAALTVAGPNLELEVRESGTEFRPRPGLNAPVQFRGVYGGAPPVLDAQKAFNSLRAGIGITNPAPDPYPANLSVGTLGFFVRGSDLTLYLVSNNHVIAGENTDVPADDTAFVGDSIVQPGTLDLNATELSSMPTLAALAGQLQIAELAAWIELKPATPAATPNNQVDAAVARVTSGAAFVRTQGDIDRVCFGGRILGVRGGGTAPPYEVDGTGRIVGSTRVYKVGRTTGYTEGVVVGIGAVVTIPYRTGNVFFNDQILIQATPDNVGPFSSPGDSGSGILDDTHQLAGLLFAGSARQTIANPIDQVLAQLAAKLGTAITVVS